MSALIHKVMQGSKKYPSNPIMKALVCGKRWNASRLEPVIIRRESLQIRYTGPGITEIFVNQKASAFPVPSLEDQVPKQSNQVKRLNIRIIQIELKWNASLALRNVVTVWASSLPNWRRPNLHLLHYPYSLRIFLRFSDEYFMHFFICLKFLQSILLS